MSNVHVAPAEQDGSCSLSFLTFLHDLEADGICELLHDEVPQRLKGLFVNSFINPFMN